MDDSTFYVVQVGVVLQCLQAHTHTYILIVTIRHCVSTKHSDVFLMLQNNCKIEQTKIKLYKNF